MGTPAAVLSGEADAFHQVLFGTPVPADIRRRYIDAHQYVFAEAELSRRRAELETVEAVLHRRLDVEAVELALRRKSAHHILTQKIHILLYVVEPNAEYAAQFCNWHTSRLRAHVTLALLMLQTAFKLLKGRYLIWKHRLV